MQLTATTDYAIRIMCYLAQEKEMRNTKLIAQSLEIPASYVPKVLASLKKAGLVQALEGVNGGYSMAKAPEKITLLDIVSATEKTMQINRNFDEEEKVSAFPIRRVYNLLQQETENLLSEITIAEILGEKRTGFKMSVFNVLVDVNRDTYSCGCTYNEGGFARSLSLSGCYSRLIDHYVSDYVFPEDRQRVYDFLSLAHIRSTEDNQWKPNLQYRALDDTGYVWMTLSLYCVDPAAGRVFITANNFFSAQHKLENLEKSLKKQKEEEERFCWEGVEFITSVFFRRFPNLRSHTARVKHYIQAILKEMRVRYPQTGITAEQIRIISNLSVLHDVGKLMLPDTLLKKEPLLSAEEALEMQEHVALGVDLVERMPHLKAHLDWAEIAVQICEFHHERYDGTGYPKGLAGEEIPLCAQVVGLANAYDVLLEQRRGRCTPQEIIALLKEGACGGFAEKVMDCLVHASEKKTWQTEAPN